MFGVRDPVVMYADIIKGSVGYASCKPHAEKYSWLAITNFPTKHLSDDGEVTPNSCGKAAATPTPGELTMYVRPLTFWEKLKQ
jgi:hypothetical protein